MTKTAHCRINLKAVLDWMFPTITLPLKSNFPSPGHDRTVAWRVGSFGC
jgi:hypothetical protein